MLRELLDTAYLEDLVDGLARVGKLRVCAFDHNGRRITASPTSSEYARLIEHQPLTIPTKPKMTRVPAHNPPGSVAFIEIGGLWYVLAPVYFQRRTIGWVGVGEFRPPADAAESREQSPARSVTDSAAEEQAWEALPELDRGGQSHAVIMVRWIARMLANRCRREAQMHSVTEELSLIGDIAELLTGAGDLQSVLDRIVAETARVMRCPFSTLRLYDPETDELTIKAAHNLSRGYMQKGPVLRSENPIDDDALNGHIVYVADVSDDPRFRYSRDAQREGMVSVLTAGMRYRGQPVGLIRVYTGRRQRFRRAQRNLLRAVASQAATAIVHARLIAERLRAAETERQLALAGDVQERMIRIPPPEHPVLKTALVFQPSSHVGGDFCDFFTLPDGRLAAVVADVVGKGVPASLLMASVRGALRATAQGCDDLGEILTRLNRHICRETLISEFVTLVLVAVDEAARRLEFCSSGHEPLLLLRDGKVRTIDEAGLVLGIDPRQTYTASSLKLRPADFVLLCTDGAAEAMNFAGKLFGRKRLRAAVRQYGELEPDQALRNILWDVRRYVGLAEQSDDLTLVGLRVRA